MTLDSDLTGSRRVALALSRKVEAVLTTRRLPLTSVDEGSPQACLILRQALRDLYFRLKRISFTCTPSESSLIEFF